MMRCVGCGKIEFSWVSDGEVKWPICLGCFFQLGEGPLQRR
jgi:hypothetical protein